MHNYTSTWLVIDTLMHGCCIDIHHLLQSCVTSATDIVYFNFGNI